MPIKRKERKLRGPKSDVWRSTLRVADPADSSPGVIRAHLYSNSSATILYRSKNVAFPTGTTHGGIRGI